MAFDNGDRNATAVQPTPATVGRRLPASSGTTTGRSSAPTGGNKDVDFVLVHRPGRGCVQHLRRGHRRAHPGNELSDVTNGIAAVQRLADASDTSPQLYQQVGAGQTVIIAITGKGNRSFNGKAVASGTGGQTGSYTLNTSLQPLSTLATLSNNSIQGAPNPLDPGQAVPGNIGLDTNLVIGPGDVDIYRFTATDTRDYTFATNTNAETSADTVMRIFDASGNQICSNDNASATTTGSGDCAAAGRANCVRRDQRVGPGATVYNPLTGGGAAGNGSTGQYTLTTADAGPFTRTLQLTSGKKLTYIDAAGHKETATLTGAGTGRSSSRAPATPTSSKSPSTPPTRPPC